jgi:mannose-6-phosphate isomerase-like protein (cupin superfamily)
MAIQYTSIYADQQGVSHFRDLEIEVIETILGPLIPPLGASAHQAALETYFLTFPAGIAMDWHPAPRRLFHFFLSGSCEVTVSDGSVRTFQQGDIVLAEDTVGKGHITKNPGEGITLMAVVAVP